jgi:DNA adenine methylase
VFECRDFRDINGLKNCVVYVDPPYKNTTPYKNEFPYNEFYDWCRKTSKDNIVLISEYSMPDDFKCIWQKEIKVTMDSNRRANDKKNNRVEKLFVYNK